MLYALYRIHKAQLVDAAVLGMLTGIKTASKCIKAKTQKESNNIFKQEEAKLIDFIKNPGAKK